MPRPYSISKSALLTLPGSTSTRRSVAFSPPTQISTTYEPRFSVSEKVPLLVGEFPGQDVALLKDVHVGDALVAGQLDGADLCLGEGLAVLPDPALDARLTVATARQPGGQDRQHEQNAENQNT